MFGTLNAPTATSGCATGPGPEYDEMWFKLLAYNLRRADRLLAGAPPRPRRTAPSPRRGGLWVTLGGWRPELPAPRDPVAARRPPLGAAQAHYSKVSGEG